MSVTYNLGKEIDTYSLSWGILTMSLLSEIKVCLCHTRVWKPSMGRKQIQEDVSSKTFHNWNQAYLFNQLLPSALPQMSYSEARKDALPWIHYAISCPYALHIYMLPPLGTILFIPLYAGHKYT